MRAAEEIKHSLELDERMDMHRRGWIVQRIAWCLMCVWLLLTIAGFFGLGPVSKKLVTHGLTTLSYEKYGRYDGSMELKVMTIANGKLEVRIEESYLNQFHIEDVLPEPKSSGISNGMHVFNFDAAGPATIRLFLRPLKTWSLGGYLTVNDQPFSFSHFIYP